MQAKSLWTPDIVIKTQSKHLKRDVNLADADCLLYPLMTLDTAASQPVQAEGVK